MTSNLIRVKSTLGESTSTIRNVFNDSIRVEPYSKVALTSASIRFSNKFITVDGNNNSFTFRSKGNSATQNMTVTLANGNYNKDEFLSEVNVKMNSVLDSSKMVVQSGSPQAFQWQPNINKDGTFGFKFSRSVLTTNGLTILQNIAPTTPASKTSYTCGVIGGTWQGYGYSLGDFSNGCGSMQFIMNDNGTGNPGSICGLIDSDNMPEPGQTQLLSSAFKYGIIYEGTGNNYFIVVDGVSYDSGIAFGNTKLCKIKLSLGQISFEIEGNVYGTTYEYDYTNSGYVVGMSFKQQNNNINSFRWTLNPFQITTTQNGIIDFYANDQYENIYKLDENLEIETPEKSKVTLQLSTPEVRDLFGFSIDPNPITAVTGCYNGRNDINISNLPTSLLVTAPNLQLNSYDGRVSQRKPIIGVIPSVEVDDIDAINYEPNNLIYISLNNPNAFTLSEMVLRIENADDGEEISLADPGANLSVNIMSR